MSVRELAAGLGLSHTAVHKNIKAGMPSDSVESAKKWREENIQKVAEVEDAPTPVDEVLTDTESCKEALLEARQMRKFAKGMAAMSQKNGDSEAARKWITTHQQMLARQASIESQYRAILERDAVTVTIEEAEAQLRGILKEIKIIMTAMPASLAEQVNPTDPLHALTVLEDWRDNVFFASLYGKS
jgi:hypothetical protein